MHIGNFPPQFKVPITKNPHYKDLLSSTTLALGEAYMNGNIEVEGDLFNALNEFLKYKDKFAHHNNPLKKILYTSTSVKNQKQEVCSHYDLGNDFYKLWLDKTLSYSCAYFKSPKDSLYEAQMNKIHYLFRNVEHVLKDEGVFVLHYISALKESPGDAWIKKYIFPGGVIPSLREIVSLSAEHHFYIQDIESLRRHYIKTLLCWYNNYENNLDEVQKMFDERFIRMWRIYLCSCATSFNNGIVDLHQIVFLT